MGKAVIKNADMSEDMQTDAVECATQALEKYNIEKDIAAYIKKEFDKKYSPTGIVSSAATSARTSPMRPNTLSTSTWDRSPFSSSSRDKCRTTHIRAQQRQYTVIHTHTSPSPTTSHQLLYCYD